jgi:hypothetical protein
MPKFRVAVERTIVVHRTLVFKAKSRLEAEAFAEQMMRGDDTAGDALAQWENDWTAVASTLLPPASGTTLE